MAPVAEFIVKPAGAELKIPPGVPVSVTGRIPAIVLQKGLPAYEIVAAGSSVIVILLDALTATQPPPAGIVLTTVYMPGVLADRSTCPVSELIKTRPGVDENRPATPPGLKVGKGSVSLLQKGDSGYVKAATGNLVIATDEVAVTTPQPPAAAIVFVTV